ncbi:uncharacterized protein LOC122262252 isoform X2 [Penaeus japonicus]|uniref:uncharacterized protein LOC122262252 isoform X2 n=1 Tax=Penaeus japonicus TaxID=27405 RepID=UPI001C7161C3|nr:uncharacterized protein LOC122262252 isoform X2 [Penaeus japonicus]
MVLMTMAEGGGYHRAAGVKVVGIPARRIDLDENTNFVFMDLKWTSRKWDQELIFISALCEEDCLEAYVRPINSRAVDEQHLKWVHRMEWDGSTMKNGIPIPEERILEPNTTMTVLVEWLQDKKPFVCVVYDFYLTDSSSLVDLLKKARQFTEFKNICLGFVRGYTMLKEREANPRKPFVAVRKFRDAITALECNLKYFRKHSLTLQRVEMLHAEREKTYWNRSTFLPLYDLGVISKGHARRLAMEGWTFQDMEEIFKKHGEEGLKAKLYLVSHDKYVNLVGTNSPAVLEEEDINNICKFFKYNSY